MKAKLFAYAGWVLFGAMTAFAAVGHLEKPVIDTTAIEAKFIDLPAQKIIYRNYQGSYDNVKQNIFDLIEKLKNKGGCVTRFSQFYSNPAFVAEDKRFYRIGCIVKDYPEGLPEGMRKGELAAGTYLSSERDDKGDVQDFNTRLAAYAHQKGAAVIGSTLIINETGSDAARIGTLIPVQMIEVD